MTSSAFSEDLSVPFLSDHSSQDKHLEKDDENSPKSVPCAICMEDEDEDNERLQWKGICCALFRLIILFVQFGLLFASRTPSTVGLCWSTVNFSILLLIISTFNHRHTLDALGVQNVFAHFAPEILIDVVLGLTLCDWVSTAWLVLLQGLICLAGFAVAANLYILYKIISCKKNEDEETSGEASSSEELPNARFTAQIV